MCTQFFGTPAYSAWNAANSPASLTLASAVSTPACVVTVYRGIELTPTMTPGNRHCQDLSGICPRWRRSFIPLMGDRPAYREGGDLTPATTIETIVSIAR